MCSKYQTFCEDTKQQQQQQQQQQERELSKGEDAKGLGEEETNKIKKRW